MELVDELERIAVAATWEGDPPTAILAAEALPGRRAYICAYEQADGGRSWLVLDADGAPVSDRRDARDAVSIAALCEVAGEIAFPGDLDELRSQLVALRLTEAPDGIEAAEAAALELQHTIGAPPQLATPERLETLGIAARRLEQALDNGVTSPFSTAMRSTQGIVDELWAEVERAHRVPFS